jgi:hypothetical protein
MNPEYIRLEVVKQAFDILREEPENEEVTLTHILESCKMVSDFILTGEVNTDGR